MLGATVTPLLAAREVLGATIVLCLLQARCLVPQLHLCLLQGRCLVPQLHLCLLQVRWVYATVASLLAAREVLGATFACCRGGAWCHSCLVIRLDLWVLCWVASLAAILGACIGCCQGCAKEAKVWERRPRTMSVNTKLQLWCAVDVF